MNEVPWKDIIILVAGAYVVASWMMWWFTTSLPIHVLEVLRYFGWRSKDTEFWGAEVMPNFPKIDLAKWTRPEFDDWMHKLNPYIGELLSCPGCFSFHVAFWVSALVNTMMGFIDGFTLWRLLMFYLCWKAWPFAANSLLKKIKS